MLMVLFKKALVNILDYFENWSVFTLGDCLEAMHLVNCLDRQFSD